MSYCDLIPPRSSETVNFSRIRHEDHADIDRQINEFIAKGGGINQVPIGASASNDKPVLYNEFEKEKRNEFEVRMEKCKIGAKRNKADKPMFSFPERTKYSQRSKYGMNIQKNKCGYFVVIGAARFGGSLTHEEAVSLRDKTRKSLGMPAADY